MNDFIVQLIARLDASKTADDLKKIEQQLKEKGIKLKPVIDSATSKQEIQNLAKQLQSILSSQNLTIDTSKIVSAINHIANETPKIYKTSDLDKQGKIYVQKVSNTIEKTKSVLVSKMKSAGYFDIEIKGIEKANGQIKSLTVSATDATGVLKQLTFEQEKLLGSGKAQSGLVQTDNVKILGNISNLTATTSAQLDKLKSKWTEQGILVGDFKNKVEQLETSLSTVSSKGSLENLQSQLRNLNVEADKFAKANKIRLSIDNGTTTTQIDQLKSKFQELGFEQDEIVQKMKSVTNSYINLKSAISGGNNNAIISANDTLNRSLKETDNLYKQIKADSSLYYNTAKQTNLSNDIQNWLSKNTAATRDARSALREYLAELNNGRVNVARLNEIQSSFQKIDTQMRSVNKLGKSFIHTFTDGMKKFSYWTSSTFIVMKAIQEIRQAVTNVKELDTALIDLRKTTTMTVTQLREFYYSANSVAKQMGVTTQEIIEQASAWSRLGYSSQDAVTHMAKLSSQFAIISPDMNVDSATNGLVSIMKAFDIAPEKVLDGIMSKINEIGNTAATSNGEIVNMLSKSSSAMKEANNTLEETIALETAAVEITRDDDSVGTAYKTVSMRLRGYDEEVEAYTKDVEELSGEIANLTKTASTPGGISLFTDANKTTYKSTYQLLKEISKIYDQLDDKTQAKLLEAIAGRFYLCVQKCIQRMNLIAGNA